MPTFPPITFHFLYSISSYLCILSVTSSSPHNVILSLVYSMFLFLPNKTNFIKITCALHIPKSESILRPPLIAVLTHQQPWTCWSFFHSWNAFFTWFPGHHTLVFTPNLNGHLFLKSLLLFFLSNLLYAKSYKVPFDFCLYSTHSLMISFKPMTLNIIYIHW